MFHWFFRDSGLLGWPLVGLGVCFATFVMVVLYVTFVLRRGEHLDRIASLPLDDETSCVSGEGDDAE